MVKSVKIYSGNIEKLLTLPNKFDKILSYLEGVVPAR